MVLGVILIILIAVLAAAILVAIVGYTLQVIQRYRGLKNQPGNADKNGCNDPSPKSPVQ